MGGLTASAPGKVVLSGEYAVLDGAPAVAMAVDRRATVSIDDASQPAVVSSGLDGEPDTRLLDCVCSTLGIDRPNAAITLDTGAFVDATSGKKLGIGSSAALAVALVRALAARDADADTVFKNAIIAHRDFQRGRGSGVDVAVSASGGLIEFEQGSLPASLSWPADLDYAMLWSGTASSTTSKLAALERQAAKPSRESLHAASRVVADRWRHGDAAALIDAYRDYIEALTAFDVDHGLGIFDAGHDELTRHRSRGDIVYKPCGAGGGDIGVVLGVDPDAIEHFVQFARSHGFRRLDLALDPQCASLMTEPA